MRAARRGLAIPVLVLVLLAALGGIYWRVRAAQVQGDGGGSRGAGAALVGPADTFPPQAPVVVGLPVARDTLILSVSAAGEAEATRAAALTAEVAGAVLDVPVGEGDFVRRGQVLARIDPMPYELALRQSDATLVKAKARFAELILFDREIADPDVRAERAAMARVHSGLAEAEIAHQKARLDLERATVRAPFSGVVANLAVVPGQRVDPADSVCSVVDLSQIRVAVPVLEGEVVHLGPGREARVVFGALPDTAFSGRVTTINPVLDRRMRTARVTVTLDNRDRRIRPGMYAQVRIAAQLFPDRVVVPRQAILERDRRKLVFVFEPESPGSDVGLAKWTYVTTGLQNENSLEIVPADGTTMLQPGQIVLIEGHSLLIHDARVRLVEE